MRAYVLTSAKFEECYIEEWVQYNLNIGFDKIIINDNNPKDYPYKLKDILKKYIDNGQVVIERFLDTYIKDNNKTEEDLLAVVYTSLYNKYKDEFDWVAKLDVDEYLEIPETNNDIKKFLSQNKFNNALSIVIPLVTYTVKNKYKIYYDRLKSNKDRFEKMIDVFYMSKSIIKNVNCLQYISLHYAQFTVDYKNAIHYCLPDGTDGLSKFFNGINDLKCGYKHDFFEEQLRQKQYRAYIDNIVDNVCHINHYSDRSIEENCIKTIKFEGNTHSNSCLREWYLELKEQYPDMIDHPRDLYKIYFIDNINNIQED